MLEFRGRKRQVMTPGRYTELFFLDEATAQAAGHRPCAECRHTRFLDFCNAWGRAHPDSGKSARPAAQEIDDRLHAERIAPARSKRTFETALDGQPTAYSCLCLRGAEQAFLVRSEYLLAWSPGEYSEGRRRPKVKQVRLLTPPSTVKAIQAGYVPDLHQSALALT
jgi:hypothetical protein